MQSLKASIFDLVDEIDPEADARHAAEAEADLLAERTVPNAKVIEWLKTWGKPDQTQAPYSWRK